MNTKILVRASGKVAHEMLTPATGPALAKLRDRLLSSLTHGQGETLEMYTQQTDLTFRKVW